MTCSGSELAALIILLHCKHSGAPCVTGVFLSAVYNPSVGLCLDSLIHWRPSGAAGRDTLPTGISASVMSALNEQK